MQYTTNSETETFNLGAKLSCQFHSKDVVLLYGELGVGKSVFIRGVARQLGITEPMPSPTFTIVNQYVSDTVKVNHFDLYRISDPYELYEIGFEEYIYDENSITFIEWPEKAADLLPDNCTTIRITIDDNDCRQIDIQWSKSA